MFAFLVVFLALDVLYIAYFGIIRPKQQRRKAQQEQERRAAERKAKAAARKQQTAAKASKAATPQAPRKRGRPRKNPSAAVAP